MKSKHESLSPLQLLELSLDELITGEGAQEVVLQLLLHLMQLQQGELRFFAGVAELVAAMDRLITLSADLQHLLKSLKPRGLLLAGCLSLL
jgi:hypothetical protein